MFPDAAEAVGGGCSDELPEVVFVGGDVRARGGADAEAPRQGGDDLPGRAAHGHVARALGQALDVEVPSPGQDPDGRL